MRYGRRRYIDFQENVFVFFFPFSHRRWYFLNSLNKHPILVLLFKLKYSSLGFCLETIERTILQIYGHCALKSPTRLKEPMKNLLKKQWRSYPKKPYNLSHWRKLKKKRCVAQKDEHIINIILLFIVRK